LSATAAGQREFLTFTLGKESYAIDILKVQEIRGYEQPTRIANTPEFIKGVINLRGHIVPIVDLRREARRGRGALRLEHGGHHPQYPEARSGNCR
jgi:chemotaxis signal transduction protein